jgi:type IV secretory pathway VirB2 component (pilin)
MSFSAGFSASESLADPPGSSVLLAAVSWLEGTMLGTVAATAAILAIAAIGAMMLTGRLAVRQGLSAVLGCFVLFGASSIAAGIGASAGSAGYPAAPYSGPAPLPPLPEPAPPPGPAAAPGASDPHAGASVPSQ